MEFPQKTDAAISLMGMYLKKKGNTNSKRYMFANVYIISNK